MAINYTNASRERRRDAVSRDYLTAFSLGPSAISDTSDGLVSHAWRGRIHDGGLWLSRAGTSAWETETHIVDVPSSPIVQELDFCFAQNGDVVACFGMDNGTVWMYWFNSLLGHYVLDQRVVGRTPRIALDDPNNENTSDIQVFYISDTFDELRYLQQRERYATPHTVPFETTLALTCVEDVFRGSDGRLHVLLSVHNTDTGRYSYGRISSSLFPIAMASPESADLGVPSVVSADLVVVFLYGFTADEEVELEVPSVVSADLQLVLGAYAVLGELAQDVTLTDLHWFDLVAFGYTAPDAIDVAIPSVVSATLVVIIIFGYTDYEPIDIAIPSVVSVSLV